MRPVEPEVNKGFDGVGVSCAVGVDRPCGGDSAVAGIHHCRYGTDRQFGEHRLSAAGRGAEGGSDSRHGG